MKYLPILCKSLLGNIKFYLLVILTVLPLGYVNIQSATAEEMKSRKVPSYAKDMKQIQCMAANIFYEARGESERGKKAVARVVMNRISYKFGSNPCTVVYQKTVHKETKVASCQFHWVCENKSAINKRDPLYKQSEQIAYEVVALNQHKDVIPNNILFFHNTSVSPDIKYKQRIQIGNHIFYEQKKRNK